ncbi:DUF6152 family protein [Roseateles sp.]|uniref:DUF6152 family protein n=1 Tax=Roseateles sp. TaxID=1971397 RepID=UPI0037C7D01B
MTCAALLVHRRQLLAGTALLALPAWVRAHHGWSSFDQERPIYLAGKALKVAWRNPHAELELDLAENLSLPADLKQRLLPRQTAPVDGSALLAKAQLPTRRDRRWQIELAPLTRMQAWGVAEIKAGDALELLGFSFAGERGEPVLRVEYLFAQGRIYGLRSAPA